MDKPTTEPILYDFLQALVNDQWVEPRIKVLAKDALAQYEPAPAEQAKAETAERNKSRAHQ